MKKTTEAIIKNALKMDPTIEPEVRMAIVAAMRGERTDGELAGELSLAEAAEYLGIGRIKLWRWVKRGSIEATRRGKKFYFSGAVLKAIKQAS